MLKAKLDADFKVFPFEKFSQDFFYPGLLVVSSLNTFSVSRKFFKLFCHEINHREFIENEFVSSDGVQLKKHTKMPTNVYTYSSSEQRQHIVLMRAFCTVDIKFGFSIFFFY